jgi:PAS domain S-box-containing protein
MRRFCLDETQSVDPIAVLQRRSCAMATPVEDPSDKAGLESRIGELEQRLEGYRSLVGALSEASADGIAILDASGVFLEVNAAFESLTGLPRQAWVGRSVDEMQKLPTVPRTSATREALRTGREASTLIRGAGDSLVLITATPHRGPGGEIRNVILNMRNLTRLNAIKEELERERGMRVVGRLTAASRERLRAHLDDAGMPDLICASPAMEELLATATEIAGVDATVLLEGETGTGKGMLARFLHACSPRRAGPLVEVNCGALPADLVEAELFGYAPGAFTGSLRQGKKGQFELAHRGTIFLDEIGELPLPSQTKLLKVLDDKEIRPIGAEASRAVDVRVVCATNRDLHERVAAGEFREDLLYRIEVIPIRLPPLRERPEDKKALLYAALEQTNRALRRDKVLSLEALAVLTAYDFPGNVRELRNLVERLVTTTRGSEIHVEDLPAPIREVAGGAASQAIQEAIVEESVAEAVDYRARVERLELQMLRHFARTCSSTYEIARRTGLTQSAVVRKLKKFDITIG